MKFTTILLIALFLTIGTGCNKRETSDGAATSSKEGGDVGTGSTGSLGSSNTDGSLPETGKPDTDKTP